MRREIKKIKKNLNCDNGLVIKTPGNSKIQIRWKSLLMGHADVAHELLISVAHELL
jgi:hypothetical protein